MHLVEALLPLLPHPEAGAVIAVVGAGGKTSALFGLGQELALEGTGRGVLMTTTTHMFDPRREPGRLFDQLLLAPWLADPAAPGAAGGPALGGLGPAPAGRGRRVVLAARAEGTTGKLCGIHPARIAELMPAWPFIVVEADGAKRLPVKAPADHEPVVPAQATLVLGVVGLDCLGRPMDADTVHRPERFGPLTGCVTGAAIGLEHIAALARSPQGLFKGAPAGARRVLVLNQADLAAVDPHDPRLRGCADLVLCCALADPAPERRVLAQAQ